MLLSNLTLLIWFDIRDNQIDVDLDVYELL